MMNSESVNNLSIRHSYFEVEAMTLQVKSFIKEGLIMKLNNEMYLYGGKTYDFATLLLYFFDNKTEFVNLSAKWEMALCSRRSAYEYSECV